MQNVKLLTEKFERISIELKSGSPIEEGTPMTPMQTCESHIDDDEEFFECISSPILEKKVQFVTKEQPKTNTKYTRVRKRDKIKNAFKKVAGHDQASVAVSPCRDNSFEAEFTRMNKDSDNVSLKSFSWETASLKSFNAEFEMMKFIFNESAMEDGGSLTIRKLPKVKLNNIFKQKFRNPFRDEMFLFETSSGSYDLYSIPMPEEVLPIINELIETEKNYVQKLRKGFQTYGSIFNKRSTPISLKGKKGDLLGNIELILEFHEKDFLPMLLRNRNDFQDMVNDFRMFLEEDKFYPYIPYMINSARSKQLCKDHQEFFKKLQNQFDDQLGISSFLLQPTQRLPRYSLMFHEITKTLFKVGKSGDCKKLLALCTQMDKRIRKFVEVVNNSSSLNDVVKVKNISLNEQGRFLAVDDFKCIDYISRKGYKAKVFLFSKSLVFSEETESKLVYRGHFLKEDIILKDKDFDEFQISCKRKPQWKCVFSGHKDNFIKALKNSLAENQQYENMKFRSQHSLVLEHRTYKAVDCEDGINFEMSDDESYC